jgi:CDP-diacylglycerol--glycerol-3-phosphate 3-phosphatidyltransferase
VALVPVFIVFFYMGEGYIGESSADNVNFTVWALVVFIAAALTDAADGHIARKYGLATNFGKLMDPLADKILTASAFVCFVDTGIIPAWVVIVILSREFLITGLRSVAASEGVVIAAGFSGKLKTVLQMATIALFLIAKSVSVLLDQMYSVVWIVAVVCLVAALVATVYSGVEYLWKSRKLLNLK